MQVRQCRADAHGRGLEQEYRRCRQQGCYQGQWSACAQWKQERDYPEYSHYCVYWTLLLLGEQDYYTFEGNWLHDVSGRAPHMGTDHTSSQIFSHGVDNYFQDLGGHAFDIDTNTWVLLEGNYFANVNTPLTEASLTAGRYAVADVPAKVVANAGVGKL